MGTVPLYMAATMKQRPGFSVVMDLNRARPIHLSLIDGIKTMKAAKAWIQKCPVDAGAARRKNPVATDAVATAVMGFDPTADPPAAPFLRADNHLNLAYGLGLGTNRLGDIKVMGVPVDEVRQPFKPSEA
jgi:hypothetical protein